MIYCFLFWFDISSIIFSNLFEFNKSETKRYNLLKLSSIVEDTQ